MAVRLLAAVAILTLVSACSGTRELQHDGSGTDEMLKSPCACMPVPFDPQFYRWSVG